MVKCTVVARQLRMCIFMRKKIKWVLSVLVITCFIALSPTVATASTEIIRVGIDNVHVYVVPVFDYIEARVVDGHVLVPARAFFEMLGARVDWYDQIREAWIELDGRLGLWLPADSHWLTGYRALFPGLRSISFDAPVQIIDDRMFIPLSFFTRDLNIDDDFIERVVVIDSDELPAPHPFALALRDYFAGNVSYNPDTGEKSSNPVAYLVDVDGNGTQGVLARRNEARYSTAPFPFGKVFYMYDGKLFYKDVGLQDVGFVTHITADGNRIVNRSIHMSGQTYTLFSIENGRLTAAFTIRRENICLRNLYYNYYYWTGGFGFGNLGGSPNRKPITEEEFNAIHIRYGLDRMRSWQDNDTEQILAMITE